MQVLIAALMLQYVISVKAGLVNHVQGTANVAMMETVRAGHSIHTGRDGYVEILLRPGSFLRLGEDSEATLDDTDLASVKVTITRGPALVEAAEISKDHPITVTTGNLTTKITNSGIYRFENGVATVLLGKLQTGDSKLTYEKGWQVFFQDNYRARKTNKMLETSLDVYSQSRSATIAEANLSMVSTLSPASYSSFDIWLYSPYLRLYTFIPTSDYRSPYGYRYYGVSGARVVRQNGGSYSTASGTTSSSSGGNTTSPTPVDNSNNSGGGGAPAPAPIVSTPAGEPSTPATYVDSKNSAVGATVR
jgi:hypothetical protein